LTIWSKWFGGESRRSPDAAAVPRALTLTVGEVLDRASPSPDILAQRCVLCEAIATVVAGESEIEVDCATCGQYCAAVDASRALDLLVKYRKPALAQMRELLAEYRESQSGRMPRIRVQYAVSDGVPTFYVTSN
jgi:ribosomal protein S27E